MLVLPSIVLALACLHKGVWGEATLQELPEDEGVEVEKNIWNPLDPYIVRGAEAPRHFFNYQAALTIQNEGEPGGIMCGGALIDPSWILTAAHCVQMPGSGKFVSAEVILGAHYRHRLEPTQQRIRSSLAFMHPGWSHPLKRGGAHDIALMKLDRPANLNDFVGVVRLPNQLEKHLSFENMVGRVAGWGITETGQGSQELKFMDTRVINNAVCEIEMINTQMFTETNICTSGAEGKGLGQGDSGGPLVTYGRDNKPVVIGVCSFIDVASLGGRPSGKPSAYSRVTLYLDWINQVMLQN